MKLKRIDLYIKLNQMEKANELMHKVEEQEEARINSSNVDNVMSSGLMMPPLPPMNVVIVGDGQVV